MYETFFGLKRRPFLFVPDVEAYFSVDFMEESLQIIEHAIQKGEGNSLIFGATGTGKTLLMRLLRQSLETEYTVALVSHCRLETPKALFLQLAHDLRLPLAGTETIELRLQILDFARNEPTNAVVLLFDDAQHLSPAVLEEIRLLTDSADDTIPLFRAVLAGTLEFEEKLTLPELEAFNQRVASRCYLDSFSGEETSRYIACQTDDLRIDPPHSAPTPLFTESVRRRIHQLTDGIPRLINQLCGTSLQLAAGQNIQNIDEALIDDAWASLQHIELVDETEMTEASNVHEPAISQEQIAEIIDRKRNTFQIRQFDSVEFGTLTDSDLEPESSCQSQSYHENEYKPPYPEDEEDDLPADWETEAGNLPACRLLQLHVPADTGEADAGEVDTHETDAEPAILPTKPAVAARRKLVSDIYKQERKFRRREVLQKIQNRLGLFAGFFLPSPSTLLIDKSDMDTKSLQEYGAAVLDGRPPFIRKEPHYAYHTADTMPQREVTYPDPKTGAAITLCWLPEETEKTERFGVSYSDFLNREKLPEPVVREQETVQPAAVQPEPVQASIVRTSLNASQSNREVPVCCPGLEEFFEESQQVGGSVISLAELFRTDSSTLLRMGESLGFKELDGAVLRQLEGVVRRIIKAAEKIERAAEVSERAGQHVSQAAEYVEAEVKSALPTCTDLFRQWSEFQNMISVELETLRQQNMEPLKFQSAPRRQVMIERTVPTINVESLLR